jgi:hypothetical protein
MGGAPSFIFIYNNNKRIISNVLEEITVLE